MITLGKSKDFLGSLSATISKNGYFCRNAACRAVVDINFFIQLMTLFLLIPIISIRSWRTIQSMTYLFHDTMPVKVALALKHSEIYAHLFFTSPAHYCSQCLMVLPLFDSPIIHGIFDLYINLAPV